MFLIYYKYRYKNQLSNNRVNFIDKKFNFVGIDVIVKQFNQIHTMKKLFLPILSLLSMLISINMSAANVTKVVITAVDPEVGEKCSYEASVPETASTEVYEVNWSGDFNNGRFIQGNDYTITVKLRIKASSANVFSQSSTINATVNGKKAKVSQITTKSITVKYTWKMVGGENPNSPQYKIKEKLNELAAAYNATNLTTEKDVLEYLRSELPKADIWASGDSYRFKKVTPSATMDGHVILTIGIIYDGIRIDNYNFKVILPAINKSADAQYLTEDMALMKETLDNMLITAKTTGKDLLAEVNAVAINGTKATWADNYTYKTPTSDMRGSIEGNIILSNGNWKDYIRVRKTLPIKGNAADAAIDTDFSTLSHSLHNVAVSNKTTQEEMMKVANAAMKNGSELTCTDYIKTDATAESEGKIVMYFEMAYKDKVRSPRIAVRIPKVQAPLPPELAVTQDEWELLRLTNIKRHKARLPLLVMASPLQDAAHIRAKDLLKKYSHTRPDGTNFTSAIDEVFISHRSCSENILSSATKPSQAIDAWMNSPGHKANILNENHCYIGTGTSRTTTTHNWVQIFVGECTVIQVSSSTGSYYFDTVEDMENAYLICEMGWTSKAYIPLDVDYMTKDGDKYSICLKGKTVTCTVGY